MATIADSSTTRSDAPAPEPDPAVPQAEAGVVVVMAVVVGAEPAGHHLERWSIDYETFFSIYIFLLLFPFTSRLFTKSRFSPHILYFYFYLCPLYSFHYSLSPFYFLSLNFFFLPLYNCCLSSFPFFFFNSDFFWVGICIDGSSYIGVREGNEGRGAKKLCNYSEVEAGMCIYSGIREEGPLERAGAGDGKYIQSMITCKMKWREGSNSSTNQRDEIL